MLLTSQLDLVTRVPTLLQGMASFAPLPAHCLPSVYVQEEPLDLSVRGKFQMPPLLPSMLSSKLQLKGRSRRRCPVPLSMTTTVEAPVDHLPRVEKRQLRPIKRPRQDPNFVTGDDLDDHDYIDGNQSLKGDADFVMTAPSTKRRKGAKAKVVKNLIKEEKKEEGDMETDGGSLTVAATGDTKKITETGETVILELKCLEPGCGEMLKTRDAFNRHLLYIHFKFPYSCLAADCKKEFEIMGELGPHVRDRHGGIGSWPCEKCARTFPTHRGLRHHLWYYHLEGRFACPVATCKFEANLPIAIKQHRYREHSPLYTCEVQGCGRIFKQRSNLIRHGRTHSGVKPFRCNYNQVINGGLIESFTARKCCYSSEVRSHVIRHIRARHLRIPVKKGDKLISEHQEQPDKYLIVID